MTRSFQVLQTVGDLENYQPKLGVRVVGDGIETGELRLEQLSSLPFSLAI